MNSTNVVCPVIDVISWEKLEYSTIRGPPGVRGGFNWGLQFKWKKIPDYEQQRRQHDETRWVSGRRGRGRGRRRGRGGGGGGGEEEEGEREDEERERGHPII